MTDDPGDAGWARLQGLFEAALEVPAGDRAAWVRRSVDDPVQRAELIRLLRGHEDDGLFDSLSDGLSALASGEGGEEEVVPADVAGYRVESLIGEGGTARVYAARAADSGERVAIKLIRATADTERVRRRFLAEREILAGLGHPGIARFIEAGVTREGAPYLVTEFVDGQPIHAWCDARGADARTRIELVGRVCDAVAAAHAVGVVHRDLKPPNILVDAEGCPRLLDFGIAKVLDGVVFPHLQRKTSTGVRVLTLQYASPEQLLGTEITPASDVYQLGLLIHRLLTGTLPPMSATFTTGRGHSMSSLGPGLEGVEAVVRRALERDGTARYPDAAALSDALTDAVGDGASETAPDAGARPFWSGLFRRGGAD